MKRMAHSRNCPYCGKATLNYFERTPTTCVLACPGCRSLFPVRTTWGIAQELILAGITAFTGIISIIAFFGIRSMDDLRF
jgi:hypothetical protein